MTTAETPLQQLQANVETIKAVADQMATPATSAPDTRAVNWLTMVSELAKNYGPGLIQTQLAADPAPAPRVILPGDPIDPPGQLICPDGTTLAVPPPVIGGLNRVTDTSRDFFPAGALGAVEAFFVNIMADIAAALTVFGQVGAIQARELVNGFNAIRPTVAISPEVAADMVERNILPKAVALEEAKAGGVGPDRFDALIDESGEPPGIMQMIELLRRDLIGEERFYQAVAYSRTKTEYICDLLNLRYETMSAADAVESYIKGIPIKPNDFVTQGLTPPAGADEQKLRYEFYAAMFRRGGGLPSQWDLMWQAAGDAIGVAKSASLLAHGEITEAEWNLIVGRSRINPLFYDVAKKENIKYFSAFQVGAIVEADPSLAPQATTWLLQDGYPRDQVVAYIAAKAGGKVAKPRNETATMVEAAYEAGIIDHGGALTELQTLGYHAAEADLILRNVEARRELAIRKAAISRVRAAFLARHIDVPTATTDLTDLKVAEDVIPEYIRAWRIERETQTRQLTLGQVGSLVHKNRIGKAAAIDAWVDMGFTAGDAEMLWEDYRPTEASIRNNVPSVNFLP